MKPLNVNNETFERDVLGSTHLTIVDFWAPWCGPCKMIAPVLDELASRYDGEVRIAKVNVDEDSETSRRFSITGIPTLLFFKNGQIVDRLTGAVPKNQLETRIRRLIPVQSRIDG